MEVLEDKLPKFFKGLVGLYKELGGQQQDVKNRDRMVVEYYLLGVIT
jgi:hypothetical protein